jgi:DNA repair exonuclease SbcCD ATPase subunit
MNKDKKLYKIENKLGTFYIVAGTFDEAADELKARLDQADYGFFQYRDIPAIEHVATQSFYNDELKQSFSDSKPNLIISSNDPICQREFAEQMALKCEECEKLKHDYDQMAADLADADEQLLKMQAEAEKKQKAYDDYVTNAEKVYGDLLDENRRLAESTDEQESLQQLQQKLDDALAENRQLHERLSGVIATTGSYMIAVERERQIKNEGYGAEHDQVHAPMTLAKAAVSYILCNDERKRKIAKTTYWPWEDKYYKPRDMKRNLVRAGALVAAAIDRLLAEDVQSHVEPCDKCPNEVSPER